MYFFGEYNAINNGAVLKQIFNPMIEKWSYNTIHISECYMLMYTSAFISEQVNNI